MSARVNLLEPAVRDNPYPHYAEMRRNSPVCQVDPGGFWVVTRYDDVVSVLKNPQVFSSEALKGGSEQGWLENNPLSDSMIMMDPPKHGRMRALVSRAFNAQALARLEPRIRAVSEQLTAQVLERRNVDFIADFALPLPASVIALLLGLDLSLAERFKRWSDDMVSAPAIASTDTKRQAEVRATVQEMHHHLKQVLDDRRRNPGDDMVSDLLRVQVDGESLTERELLGFFFLLLVAGLETTVHLLGHTARILAERPEVLARVRAEPALIPRLVEEVLRYEPPTHATMRMVMEDVTLGGVKLARGTPLIVMMGSAVRDGAYVSNPEDFSLDRTTQTHMTFGHGIHFCLGAPLGRLEAKLALEVLLPRCAGFRQTGPVQWNQSLMVRGPVSLPMELTPA